MFKKGFRDSLIDIWKEIEHIDKFLGSLDYEKLQEDEKTLYAFYGDYEILWETIKHRIPELRKEWLKIRNMSCDVVVKFLKKRLLNICT